MTCYGSGKNQIEEALEIAAEAHQRQYRKGTNTPYITHPYAVGLILMEAGCPESTIIAGILHDTVEDTDLTLDFIRERFGDPIANIVDGCSEDKTLRWRARKTERIQALKTATAEICTVTCADKLHNLRTIISEHDQIGDAVWERFHGGITEQAWYYRSILCAISERDAALQDSAACAKVSQHDNNGHVQPGVETTESACVDSDNVNHRKTLAERNGVHPHLFQQFQQAVTCLFKGAPQ